ncbi:MAG: M13 family metallopeptidase [Myxococcota bacterium]|nr:M13 family metallopeptidase [Myxococcota bacterium]
MRLTNALALLLAVACSKKPASTTVTSSSGSAVAQGSAQPNPYPLATKPVGPATAPLSGAPGVKVTLADVGLEQSSLDRSIDPCVDFYQFTCGGWLANNQIPPDRVRWGRFHEVDERNKTNIKALLEEAAKGIGADAATKKLGDFYASCMDEATADRAGLAAIKPLLTKVKLKDVKGWMPAVTELHKNGNWVVFRAEAHADLKDAATHALYLDASGLGLERELYLDPKAKPQVDAYKAHVAKMLGLAGIAKAEAGAADVIAIETEIARVTPAANADETTLYNAVDAKVLAKQTKAIDWKAYWKALAVEPGKKLVVKAPKLFASVDKLRARFKPAQWSSYFTFHVVDQTAVALGKPFADQQFELERIASGVEKAPDRSKRCIDATQLALGELLGQQYVTKYFPGQAKSTATKLVDALAQAVGDEIARVDWMTDATRQTALAKLGKVIRMIGYPDRWRTYDFEIKRDDFAGNLLRASRFETNRQLARWGKPVDRGDWQMNTFSIEPYYDYKANSAVLPAGVLQPPFFGQDRSIAANLGGIGILFGRELTKGFDDQGGQFDGDGNLKTWWTKDDLAKFDARAKCVEAQYTGFEAMPKSYVNGKLTLAENVSDLGGVKMAFKAYRSLRKDAAKVYVADNFTEDQQFFIAVGQAWCTRDRPAELAKRLASDPHAPPKFRVYGSLRNMKEFSEAFSCAPGTPMNPAKTCSVW